MTWNYRIIHYKKGGFGLHEVYYDDGGKVDGWTQDPISFGCDEDEGPKVVAKALRMALKDCKLPVLEEAALEKERKAQ